MKDNAVDHLSNHVFTTYYVYCIISRIRDSCATMIEKKRNSDNRQRKIWVNRREGFKRRK